MIRACFCFNYFYAFLLTQLPQYFPDVRPYLSIYHHSPIFRCKHHMVLTSPCGMA